MRAALGVADDAEFAGEEQRDGGRDLRRRTLHALVVGRVWVEALILDEREVDDSNKPIGPILWLAHESHSSRRVPLGPERGT